MQNQNEMSGGPLPGEELKRPLVDDAAGFGWIDENRTRGFATWDEEIAHMAGLGFELVPPDYHIPHWSASDGSPKLYINGRYGPREMNAAFDRPAADLGYPLFFMPNTEGSRDGA